MYCPEGWHVYLFSFNAWGIPLWWKIRVDHLCYCTLISNGLSERFKGSVVRSLDSF